MLLVLLVVASPWPFGSVTPRAASTLTAALLVLYGGYWASTFLRKRSATLPHGWIWIVSGLAFVGLQNVPLPPSLLDIGAPAVARAYAPLGTELDSKEAGGWHPISIEPFRTEWSFLQLLGLACAFHLANRLFRKGGERNLFAYGLVAAGVALSLFAVYQKARFGTLLYGRVPVESGTPFGPFVNHNHFAGYVEAAVLVALGTAMGLSRRASATALLLGGCAVLIGIAHLLSHSRGGLLALGAGLATLAWLSRGGEGAPGRRLLLAGGGLAVIAFLVLFAPTSLSERLASFANPEGDDSMQFRIRLWSDSFGLWASSPVVGTGLGTFAAAIPPYRTGPDETRAEYAESDWLQLLCEAGLIGLATAAVLILSAMGAGLREARADSSDRSRGVHHGAAAAATALAVHGFVDFNFRIPSNALLFAVLLGVVAPAGAKLSWEGRRLYRHSAALVVAVLTLAAAAYTLRLGGSDELNRRVNPLLTRPEEFTSLILALGKSRAEVPSNPDTGYLLGRLYNEEAYRSREQARYRELRLEQAGEAFRASLHEAPARGRTWFELGWTEANLGRDENADRLFPLALALEPHWANLRANYALYLVSRNRIDEALVQIEAARELEPGLTPLDALSIVGPYVKHDLHLLRRAAGSGPEAEL
ncbi:MAG TPA: O-antigen ligase family protein, partial [Vicinamibacteria bacterium]